MNEKEKAARPRGTDGQAEYTISTLFYEKGHPQKVRLFCEMPYHGWCSLQKSKSWADFLEALADAQKE